MRRNDRYFVGVIEKESESAFGVWFPDVAGAYSAADDLEDVHPNAAQALRMHVEALQTAGKPAPAARPYGEVLASEEVRKALAAGASTMVVPLLADDGRSVRLNISIDRGLADMIDDAAESRGLTRSAFLAQAAKEKILRT